MGRRSKYFYIRMPRNAQSVFYTTPHISTRHDVAINQYAQSALFKSKDQTLISRSMNIMILPIQRLPQQNQQLNRNCWCQNLQRAPTVNNPNLELHMKLRRFEGDLHTPIRMDLVPSLLLCLPHHLLPQQVAQQLCHHKYIREGLHPYLPLRQP
jgi:hypothetical protein